jgi:flagellar motor switch protein FliG
MDKRNLERVLRAAGHEISAAALAGCPQESMDLVRPLYGKIGAAALEDDAARMRVRLSSDEIEQAQTAFLEVLRNLDERGELHLGPEDELVADPAYVAAITKAILSLDQTIIKGAFRQAEGALVATAMQGMEPEAHDHILGALSKKETKRILDAIDEADPLPKRAVQGAGMRLAERLFEAAAAAKAPKAVLEHLAAVRDWGS